MGNQGQMSQLGTLGGAGLGALGVALAPETFGASLIPALMAGGTLGSAAGGLTGGLMYPGGIPPPPNIPSPLSNTMPQPLRRPLDELSQGVPLSLANIPKRPWV